MYLHFDYFISIIPKVSKLPERVDHLGLLNTKKQRENQLIVENNQGLPTSFPWPFPLLAEVREKAMGTRLRDCIHFLTLQLKETKS